MAPVENHVVDISSDEEDLFMGTSLKLPEPLDPPVNLSRFMDHICGVADYVTGEDIDDLMIMNEISAPPVLHKTANADELVVMGEFSSPPALQQKKASADGVCHEDEPALQQKKASADGVCHEDDDDCVVLDGDPDKVVTVADAGSAGDGSSDELQIVAEKGPIACRDFPHSRHLCSNLPFSTTTHVKHCTMCHCFVCDAPAPCKYWGNSNSADDHCHATDKDSKWRNMRQTFKKKLLPASFPEKHQNGVYSTMSPPRQCHVSVPQSPPISHGSHPSLSIQSPLLNEGSQNRQRHPSVRVSLSVEATVGSPRAGRGTGNAHVAQSTRSHAIFKRAGAVAPIFATRNASQFCPSGPDDLLMPQALSHASQPVQVAPTTNAFTGTSQNNRFQRSFSAPIAPQVQQGQPAGYYEVAINGVHATGPQLARSTSATQRTQCLPEPAIIIDVGTSSWQDILATVASDLGVEDYNMGIPESQHVTVDSQTMHPTANHGFRLQNEPIAESKNFTYSLVHDSAGGSVQADGPMQTSENLGHLIGQSNPVPNEAHLNDFSGAPADELPIEDAAHEPEIPNILLQFDWD
ncbi:hypothetical protein BDA96_01G240700 [Sorghum bicolor]|uniref:RPM1 interacting protein 13 n=1 Tax=Sorghum bicolor TaxID=4558 RepID=A0A921S0X2_SORBI|nr:hypothetical protein BDA96_01G240700 [Sorghum bicolor]